MVRLPGRRFSTAKRDALRARNTLLAALAAYVVSDYLNTSSSWTWLLVLVCAWFVYRIEPDPQRR